MDKRRWWLLVMGAAFLIICVLGIKGVMDKRAERKRQTEYEVVLKEYSDALKSGMSRREVESYLRLRGRSFQQMCCVTVPRNAYADIVKIGEEKAPWYCNKYNVYVAFEFGTTEPHGTLTDARDSDTLERTALFRTWKSVSDRTFPKIHSAAN
jgi:hypothetical protein